MNALELRIPPAVVALVAAICMWLLSGLTPLLAFDLPARAQISSLLVICGGIAGFVGIFAFRHAHTTVDPRMPSAARVLVTSGIYRFTRNPMYLGILLILLGWLVFLGNLLAAIMLPLFVLYINRFQISIEEQALVEKFADEYLAYQQKVRRWL